MSARAVSGKTAIAAIAVLVAVAGGTVGLAAGTGSGSGAKQQPLRCEIRVTPQKGMVSLEGVVFSDATVDGTYSLKVDGSGRSGGSSIQQGGAFSASAGRGSSLGTVALGSKGATYDVRMDIRAGGRKASCSQSVGGPI